MKKYTKWIIGSVILVGIFVLASESLQYFLKGNKMPFNAILLAGDSVDVNEGKEIFKDNTKAIKDYKGKIIVKHETVKELDGSEITREYKKLLLTKSTAKEMLKEKIFRTNIGEGSTIKTEVLETIPNIDSAKNIFFESPYNKDVTELEVGDVTIPVEYGSYSWMGYFPTIAIVIADDETYNSFDVEEANLSLIIFEKGKLDLRNPKDKALIENKLSGVFDIDGISYINTGEK